jgi:DNA-binding CsgD family transcriptional regulator
MFRRSRQSGSALPDIQQNLIATLGGEFGLTAAEASIVEQITIERTLRQVAAHKSVSMNTVKSHPKSIFF